MEKVRNPTTGRAIQVGGAVYNQLLAQGYRRVGGELVGPTVVAVPPPTIPSPTVTRPPLLRVPIPPTVNPPLQVIPGPIPNVNALDAAVQQRLREEEAQRQRSCGLCQEYYLNRYMPFTLPEVNNLRAIANHCAECGRLCEAQYYRQGVVNAPQCAPYKAAGVQATTQLRRLEQQAVNEAIRRDLAAGKDVGKYFPNVPK